MGYSSSKINAWAGDDATFHLFNLLWKFKIINAFMDARPVNFGNCYQVSSLRMIV